ncbi:TetR/AcrR family transcriptional regulator [Longirhabdus pacifica]|uniref:TetR/AcrR family transcriptional regulator n=1 Tax=Longirhabdus pacifica TaxID=2305227 RepID=UPI00100892E5|nr:TetR/AcrR family transcriptional regulator [Longirhabdus pacifica]
MSKGEETKQKILQQALMLFSVKGYEETSLKDIATSVNIKAPSIYAYFKSKESLFENVIDVVMDEYLFFIRSQADTDVSLPTEKQLYTLMDNLNKYFYKQNLGLFIKRYGLVPPEKFRDYLLHKYNESEREIRKLLYDILESSSKPYKSDLDTVVTSFICVLDGLFTYLVNYSEQEYEQRLKAAWEVYWQGITTS